MPVTTWATGKTNPLLLFPALDLLPFNWSHENEWGTAGDSYNWGAETSTPARDSTHAMFDGYAAKFTGGSSQVALCRMPYLSASWGAVDGNAYAAYAWIYPTAYTGAAAVRIQINLTKAAGVALTSASQAYADFALSTMTLNAWNLVRVATVGLTTAQQAEFVNVDYRIALVPNSGTGTFWADGCFFGRALDGQDIGINNDGAWAVTPYNPRKSYNRTTDAIPNGWADGVEFNGGFYKGRFNWNNLRNADRAAYRLFIDRCADKSLFTLLHDQSSIDRDFYALCVLAGNNYGEKQIPGHPDWSAGFEFESCPSLSASNILEEIMSGLYAARPAASTMSGKYYYATDTNQLFYSNGTTWRLMPVGTFIGRTYKTSGTTFTTGANTRKILVTAIGAGGGGGGVKNAAVSSGAGGGGGAGGKCVKVYTVSPSTGYTCAIGTGGAGGVGATPTDGSTGGNTTFTDGSTLITAKGGFGGKSMTAVATSADAALLCMLGGAGQLSTNGDFNGTGESGDTGIVVPWTGSIVFAIGAKGGNTEYGSGGNSVVPANTNSTAGVDGTGYGSGGGGAAISYGGSDVDGGDGMNGVLIVDEYS